MKKELQLNESLAALGHGKWKRALGCTLLMIGFMLGMGVTNAWAQREQGELMMSKTWTPTPGTDGHKGTITLETFVTGSQITTSTHQPNDIVLVLDFSRSMQGDMDDLQDAVTTFCNMMLEDAVNNNVDHRIAICSFASGPGTYENSSNYDGTQFWTGTQSTNYYPNYTVDDYRNALVAVKNGTSLNEEVQDAIDEIVSNNCEQGTYMQYGLDMALKVFNNRSDADKVFVSEGKTYPRGMIVVFFTDGYPGFRWQTNTCWRSNQTQEVVEEADYAVAKAAEIKSIRVEKHDAENDEKPRVYSIGILSNASNTSAYICTKTDPSTSYSEWAGRGSSGASYGAYACANGLLHFISSDFDENTTSWQPAIENNGANAVTNYEGYYFGSSQMSELESAFANIASQSGATPINMSSATIIQDVISESFKLPAGATVNDIKIYAPKLTSINNVTNPTKDDYIFETLQEGILTLGKDAAGNIGVVTGGNENRLPTSYTYTNEENQPITVNVVSFRGTDNKTLQITGFNFKENWCGKSNNTVRGRKIVIKIPAEIEDGVWGDGILTNGQMSVIYPNGEQDPIYFEQPIADVLGDVWTEIVTEAPDDFNSMDIDSPEDLAWFISMVNGRINYKDNNTVASHPNLPGKLTADIDMSAHNWVPIGSGFKVKVVDGETQYVLDNDGYKIKLAYEGDFDGNGHVITGLKNNASKYYKQATTGGANQVVVFPGMFSNVTGSVHDVFVLDADFNAKHLDDGFVHFGIIADTLTGGSIYNCEAAGRLTCNNTISKVVVNNATINYYPQDLILGGLVGFNDGGTIHSSMAMATLTGYCMGGAVGEMYNSTLANSFTNGVFNYLGESATNPSGNDPNGLFRYVGGLVGRNHHLIIGQDQKAGTINNCYVRFERANTLGSESTGAKFGQLVGSNHSDGFSLGSVTYSAVDGTITNCYTPGNLPTPDTDPAVADVSTMSFPRYSNAYDQTQITTSRGNDNMVGGTWTDGIIVGGTPLVMKLNQNVESGQATWKRTTAGGYQNGYYDTNHNYVSLPDGGNINRDYPILQFNNFKCVASTDGITLDYASTLDEMLERHNTGTMNVNTKLPGEGSGHIGGGSHNYNVNQTVNKKQSDLLYGGTINLYANDNTTKSTMSVTNQDGTIISTMVYIDENVSLLQSDDSNIDAYTCQTMKSLSDPSTYDPETGTWNETNLYTPEGQRWHFVSSSLANSEFGWSYGDNGDGSYANVQVGHNWDENPCHFWLDVNDNDYSLFPADASARPVDFYCFFEPEYHWVNFKRNGKSHWHMDNYETQIKYYYTLNGVKNNAWEEGKNNETQFIPGKGYLLAIYPQYYANYHVWDITTNNGNTEAMKNQLIEEKKLQLLQNRGTLNNGNVDIPVTYTTDAIIDLDGFKTHLEGYNLLGNPYQSYLDFDEFVEENSDLMANSKFANTYAVYDPNNDKYIQYQKGSSVGSETASRYINMHQGFFIQVNPENAEESFTGTATFTNDMRTNATDDQTGFRGEQPAYPLINFTVTDYEGETDLAVLELNRPENDGAKKLRMGSPAGRIYFRYDNTNLAIYFRNSDKDYQTLNFSAEEDGNFTLSWNMANADFSSLTLVDNITGIKTDMLTHDHYTFEGRMDDYNTRFKIVFGEMDTNEEEPVLEHFAFFDHGNLIVNGTGHFEVVDVMGRVLYAVELTDTQNTVSLPSNVRGVCMLCFTRNNETKVQKMVIQ